jgi:hypothetical protein
MNDMSTPLKAMRGLIKSATQVFGAAGLACVGIPFVVKIPWPSVFCSAGAPAAYPAPSEIMESLRNLGRFPPLTPQRGRRGILANPAVSPGEPAARRTKGDVDLRLHYHSQAACQG